MSAGGRSCRRTAHVFDIDSRKWRSCETYVASTETERN